MMYLSMLGAIVQNTTQIETATEEKSLSIMDLLLSGGTGL